MLKRILSIFTASLLVPIISSGSTASAVTESDSPFKATFIQGWLCRDWSQERWEQEFSAMKEAGFESLIIQSVCDLTYEQTDTSKSAQDSSSYNLTSAYTLYPSSLEELSGSALSMQNRGDVLEYAFRAAEVEDMQIYIGLVNDDRWWKYGWGVPETNSEGASYFSLWSEENGQLCADVIEEIWTRYGETYSEQLAGWYYVNEIWNIDVACTGTDDGVYAQIIGENINYSLDKIEELCPEKPLMISPFFNDTLSTAEQYGAFWSDIFAAADFREGDIFAHQDGSGGERSPEVIREWAQALKTAVNGENGLQFWINNEIFQTDYSSKPINELRKNVEATADLVENRILFSWNHYYNPLVNADFQPLNEEFKALVEELSSHKIGDINMDGIIGAADLVLLSRHLLRASALTPEQGRLADICADGAVDCFDMVRLRQILTETPANENIINVSTVEELKSALANAQAGDTILLQPGTYESGEYGTKASIFYSASEGTVNAHITIKSADPENPAVLKGTDTSKGMVLYVTGDYWNIENIVCCNAQKGIVLDNSNYSVIRNVEVYDTGQEGIHLRDGSSYCEVIGAKVHDAGLVSEYGEAIYIGSAKSTSGYAYNCDYNVVRDCILGPNTVAESVDVKEYTTGNIIENCTMYGGGMTATDSFVDIKGNETIVRNNICYAQDNANITDAFQIHCQVDGWGVDNLVYGNTVHFTGETEYIVRTWNGTSCTVYGNTRFPENSEYMYRAYNGSTITVED